MTFFEYLLGNPMQLPSESIDYSLMSTLAEIEAAVEALPLDQKQRLMSFLAIRVQSQSSNALDQEYERGYLNLPEDVSLSNALLSHISTDDLGDWE